MMEYVDAVGLYIWRTGSQIVRNGRGSTGKSTGNPHYSANKHPENGQVLPGVTPKASAKVILGDTVKAKKDEVG